MSDSKPLKNKLYTNNLSLCLICQVNKKDPISANPQLSSIKKVISFARDRSKYGDTEYTDLTNRLENQTPQNLHDQKAFYHTRCYSSVVHPKMLQITKEHCEKVITAKMLVLQSVEDVEGHQKKTLNHLQALKMKSNHGAPLWYITRSNCAYFVRDLKQRIFMMYEHLTWAQRSRMLWTVVAMRNWNYESAAIWMIQEML